MKRCFRCGAEWQADKKQPGFKDACTACSAYLHACRNCLHHNRSLHNQCAIPTTDFVGNREGANFCEDFTFKDEAGDSGSNKAGGQVRQQLDALFGDDSGAAQEDKLDRFKNLFE